MAQKMSFETRLHALEDKVNKLENGNIPLQQALNQFYKGVNDVSILQSTLNHAKKAITKTVDSNGDEQPYTRDTGKTNTIPESAKNTAHSSQSNSTSNSQSPFKN